MKFRFSILLLGVLSISALAEEKSTPPPRVYPVALPNYDEETATRLQIFLDNSDFGPGKIDGRMGEFFRKALVHYKRAHSMAETGAVDSCLFDQRPETYTTFTIPPTALTFVGPTASKPSEQSKLKGLKYGSLLELIAERYHS